MTHEPWRSARLRGPVGPALLLQDPRYEVIPVQGIEQKVAALPYGATVTVTASPKLGIDRTFDVSMALAARGFTVVPHFAARMVTRPRPP